MLPTIIRQNVFSREELDQISKLARENSKVEAYIHNWDGEKKDQKLSDRIYWEWDSKPNLKEIISTKLIKEIIDPAIVKVSFILHSYEPVGIHCDANWLELEDDEDSWYQIIIPITDSKSKTILFEQSGNMRDFVEYKKTHVPISEEKKIDKEYYAEELGHFWPHDRDYISIHEEFNWNYGNVLYTDIGRFHASNNFKRDIDEKACFTLLTKIKKADYNTYINKINR